MKKLSHQFDFDLLSIQHFVLRIIRSGISGHDCHGTTVNYEWCLILMSDHPVAACPRLIDPYQDKNQTQKNKKISEFHFWVFEVFKIIIFEFDPRFKLMQ